MKIKLTLFALLICFMVPAFADDSDTEPQKAGISGMMMVHGGYLQLDGIGGFSSGVGGKMTYNLTPYFRVGTEGHSSSCTYDAAGSYFSLGWGGVTLELTARKGRFQFAGGITAGGGAVNHLQYLSGTSSDALPDQVIFQSYAVFVYSPTLSFEVFIKENMALVLKADYLMGLPGKIAGGMTTGPKAYVGVMFQK